MCPPERSASASQAAASALGTCTLQQLSACFVVDCWLSSHHKQEKSQISLADTSHDTYVPALPLCKVILLCFFVFFMFVFFIFLSCHCLDMHVLAQLDGSLHTTQYGKSHAGSTQLVLCFSPLGQRPARLSAEKAPPPISSAACCMQTSNPCWTASQYKFKQPIKFCGPAVCFSQM